MAMSTAGAADGAASGRPPGSPRALQRAPVLILEARNICRAMSTAGAADGAASGALPGSPRAALPAAAAGSAGAGVSHFEFRTNFEIRDAMNSYDLIRRLIM